LRGKNAKTILVFF
jgi:hypothetical protein